MNNSYTRKLKIDSAYYVVKTSNYSRFKDDLSKFRAASSPESNYVVSEVVKDHFIRDLKNKHISELFKQDSVEC